MVLIMPALNTSFAQSDFQMESIMTVLNLYFSKYEKFSVWESFQIFFF